MRETEGGSEEGKQRTVVTVVVSFIRFNQPPPRLTVINTYHQIHTSITMQLPTCIDVVGA